jgi:hypothetical protein
MDSKQIKLINELHEDFLKLAEKYHIKEMNCSVFFGSLMSYVSKGIYDCACCSLSAQEVITEAISFGKKLSDKKREEEKKDYCGKH